MCVSNIEQDDNHSKAVKNICIIVKKQQQNEYKKRKKKKTHKISKDFWHLSLSNSSCRHNLTPAIEQSSMPELTEQKNEIKLCVRTSVSAANKTSPYRSEYRVNLASSYPTPEYVNLFKNSPTRTIWKVYRCQLNTKEETCCCSCNSDAMFEVMKSLYDCYKKKNCDHCNCILCGHLPKEERRHGEMRKSVGRIAPADTESSTLKEKKKQKIKKTEPSRPPEYRTVTEREKSKKIDVLGMPKRDVDVALPEKQTPSGKISIQKAALKKTSSEKVRKAKEAGLLTPLQTKTPEQKEKILRGLAMHGLPLPEGKTTSEKNLVKKVRKDVGLPPEPKTPSIKEKYKKAMETGIITPLEGKSDSKKEKILKAQAALGLQLPEGRTPSEKKLIAKINASSKVPSVIVPSEKIRRAKTSGLLSPLTDKTPEQKEKILKGLAFEGLPLPEGKTPSEKKLIKKVRTDLGLPPEPKTETAKDKYKKALKAGIITPLNGKSTAEKEKILKRQGEIGLELPEGRTSSEKALIAKVKTNIHPPSEGIASSENLQKGKAAGILTPLEGKTPQQKEFFLKGLAMRGLPLPKAKTASEKKIIDKVRTDIGLPPEPKTSSEKNKYNKGTAAGAIVPLEGKTPVEKEKILKTQAEMGIPLPKGRTSSEKALIKKIKGQGKKAKTSRKRTLSPEKTKKLDKKTAKAMKEGKGPSDECICNILTSESDKLSLKPKISKKVISERIAPEKLKSAKATSILTLLANKTPEQKEKILRDRVKAGLPLPKAKTQSEKELIKKVKAATGYVTPVVKTPSQKERILRSMAKQGLRLPEGKTSSEKSLISKVKTTQKVSSTARVPSEMLRKVKAAGLITPLEGKTTPEKEKILKKMHESGLPLPEGKTSSEKSLIRKIKASRPSSTPSEKLRAAKAAGLLTPLSGKTPKQKEEALKDLAKSGTPLPKGKTSSEKELIKKVRKDMGLPQEPTSPSVADKVRKAYAAGLVTPLEGKTPAQKEKILKELAKAGAPLPEGRTSSEKALIKQVQDEEKTRPSKRQISLDVRSPAISPEKRQKLDKKTAKLMKEGKGPSDECLCSLLTDFEKGDSTLQRSTPSEKKRKTKTTGLSTPLDRKIPAQKEKIIKKDKKLASPSPKRTSSEKIEKSKSKSKKIGVQTTKKSAKSIGAIRKSAGIVEEFQDIQKTTTCERGCGCDKKKIRFKHSYVKIRVTSPDISSLCPCPNECIPGVKSGVFTDNEGIKVTVGRVLGVPSFSIETTKNNISTSIYVNDNFAKTSTDNIRNDVYSILNDLNIIPNEEIQDVFISPVYASSSDECVEGKSTAYRRIYNDSNKYNCDSVSDNYLSEPYYTSYNISQIIDTDSAPSVSISIISKDCFELSGSSFESIYLVKTESSLTLSTQSRDSVGEISVISLVDNSIASHSSHYLCYPQSEKSNSDETAEQEESFMKQIDYSVIESEITTESARDEITFPNTSYKGFTKNTDLLIYRVSGMDINNLHNRFHENKRMENSVLVINDLRSEHDIRDVVKEIISNKLIEDVSSVFIIVASSNDVTECSGNSSSVYIQMCENLSNWNNNSHINENSDRKQNKFSANGLKINTRDRTAYVERSNENRPVLHELKCQRNAKRNINRGEKSQNENKNGEVGNQIASVDTTCDRPCCCQLKAVITPDYALSNHRLVNVVSELITPMILKQGIAQGLTDKTLLSVQGLSERTQPLYGSIQMEPTSITSCIIPPCSGRKTCHDIEPPRENVTLKFPINPAGTSRPCYCRPAKFPDLLHSDARHDTNSENLRPGNISILKLGGAEHIPTQTDPIETLQRLPAFTKIKHIHTQTGPVETLERLPAFTTIKNTSCETCDLPKVVDYKKKSYFCSGKDKKIKAESTCPCAVNDQRRQQRPVPETKSLSCQCDNKDSPQHVPESKDTCICRRQKKSKRNIICECPENPEMDESLLLKTPLVDEKLNLKMQSDLTKTNSGFKIHTQKKVPAEEEMSYEDIMHYYKNFLTNDEGDTLVDRPGCDCETSRKKSKNVYCECPYEPPQQEIVTEIPLKGLKFHIGGKGSGSKGLSGICCFDMIHENKRVVRFQSKSYLNL